MSLSKVILVTSAFPFLPGEQFIESEMKYWEHQRDTSIRILPLTTGTGKKRWIPSNIYLDERVAEKNIPISSTRPAQLVRGLISKGMFDEFFIQARKRLQIFPYMIVSNSKIEAYRKAFNSILRTIDALEETVIYCYWHNEACYALQDLKSAYGYKLISRVHRYDLYSDERPHGYMPSKRRYIDNIDSLYALSNSAIEYLDREYHFPRSRLKSAGLGVIARDVMTPPSQIGSVKIVSCSNMVEVKNIKMIIDLLCELSGDKKLQLHWTHIGSGPIRVSIESYARRLLADLHNVSYEIIGEISNEAVFKFYRINQVDFFINVSRSEGQPVSIMEAMSCSIPIVAPDVGGIPEMFEDGSSGILFSHTETVSNIALRIRDMGFLKDTKYRKSAFETYSRLFDAGSVYPDFIDSILEKA